MALTIVEAARLMWCPGLAQLTGHPQKNIQEWLRTANYAPAVSQNTIVLSGINKHHFLEALATDINRISTAASETLKNIVEIDNLSKSLGWPYVKLYYSSMFYAHSLLRIWGRSPSYFRTLELMNLRDSLKVYSITPPYKVQTGQYLLAADVNASVVNLTNDNGSGGAHEFLWREFLRALDDLQGSIANAPYLAADKTSVGGQLTSLKALISKNGKNSSWPSQMRNDIQYRQAEGVWYPYQGKSKISTLAQEVTATIGEQIDLPKIMTVAGDELSHFRSACLAVICLARGVIADMGAIGGAKGFLRHGQRKFEDSLA